jgi:transcriptional regulator with XRE-family HTH domain
MADDIDQTLDRVGERLRTLRQRRGMRLADVAEQTGIGVSTLSRLESGARRASLELLLPLARAYRVPLDDLVGAPASGDPRIHPKPHRQANGAVWIPLSRRGGEVEAVKMVLPGHDPAASLPLRTHDGYEWLYVLSGAVRLSLDGVETRVEAGQAAEFDTRTPHAIVAADRDGAEVLGLFSPQGARIHTRA